MTFLATVLHQNNYNRPVDGCQYSCYKYFFMFVNMSFDVILNDYFFITFSSTVSSLHARVDSLEKSNTKLIEEVLFLSNTDIRPTFFIAVGCCL